MSWLRRHSGKSSLLGHADTLVTYADWSDWFEAFARGGEDDRLLLRAAASQPMLKAGSAQALAERAGETLELRLNDVGTMLQLGLSRIKTEHDAVRAILNARNAFLLLQRFAELPCWSDSLRTALMSRLDHHRSERQKRLLENAASDRTGRLATAIRNNPIDRTGLAPSRSYDTPSVAAVTPSRPRRPILS